MLFIADTRVDKLSLNKCKKGEKNKMKAKIFVFIHNILMVQNMRGIVNRVIRYS